MWIEIFRTGNFTDSRGRNATYTAEMLDDIVAKYNSQAEFAGYSAPLVKGHPQSNDPALGWVERLARRGKVLVAKLKDLSQEIIDDVRTGKFKKVSIAIYPDLLLRHVGLLGAAQPAVQGLQPVEFEESEDTLIFSSDIQFGADFSEPDSGEAVAQLTIENERLRKEITELKRSVKARHYREFAEDFFKKNPYLAKTDALIAKVAEILTKADMDRDAAEFAETGTMAENLIEFFDSLKPAMLFETIKSNYKPAFETADFDGKNVVEERLAMHKSAMALLAEFPEMTYQQAVNQVVCL